MGAIAVRDDQVVLAFDQRHEYGRQLAGFLPILRNRVGLDTARERVASDGDYSEEWNPAAFEDWVRFAGENGMYVVLDLQPGREDFLTQAKQYRDLLMLPYVGLALDPEWRLEPDQVHLRQIGHITAAEVNTVVEWLANLVRDNGLPQKLLLVHQFKFSMIEDRETLQRRPELQMVIQMDGQGPIPTKDETYAALTEGTEDAHWRWGWKNFFLESRANVFGASFSYVMLGDVPAATNTVRHGSVRVSAFITARGAPPAFSRSPPPSRENVIAIKAPPASGMASRGLRFSANAIPSSRALMTSS